MTYIPNNSRKGNIIIMMSTDIGIDLGTASILVYIKGKGVVLKEPSVVAFDRDTNKIKAIGEEARLMLGRTPGNIVAVRPDNKDSEKIKALVSALQSDKVKSFIDEKYQGAVVAVF